MRYNQLFLSKNPIRLIESAANAIWAETGIRPLPFYIGNPTTPQSQDVVVATVHSVRTRPPGYGPHPGLPENRKTLAAAFNDFEGVPGHFEWQDVGFAPGATPVSEALIRNQVVNPGDGVLIPRPGYDVYYLQTLRARGTPLPFLTNQSGLLDFDHIKQEIDKFQSETGKTAGLIIVNYPSNPTGKTLSADEAKKVAEVINNLVSTYPDLAVYNDSIYHATTMPEEGYNSFYPHLIEKARLQTATGMSGSKMTAQSGERIGGYACKDNGLLHGIQAALASGIGGINAHAEAGFTAALGPLMGTFRPAPFDPNNERHKIAKHYSERRELVIGAIAGANAAFERPIIRSQDTGGSMFVWANMRGLRGAVVPEQLRSQVGSGTIETGEHLKNFLLHQHKLGYLPIALCPGEAFRDDPKEMTVRLSCVDRDLEVFRHFGNSLKGAIQILTGKDLGVKPSTEEELKRQSQEIEKRSKQLTVPQPNWTSRVSTSMEGQAEHLMV